MAKSKDYIQGYNDALELYAWMDNSKQKRVGIPGIFLKDALLPIEVESEEIAEPEPIAEIEKVEGVEEAHS